jgi:CheY-like chemotaxis protein
MGTTLFDSGDGRVKNRGALLGSLLLITFSAAMAQRPSPIRLLIIDDDEMSRELLVALLEAKGHAVASAESGDAALALLESSARPDVILTDMQMPGSTPVQLAGRLRRACGRKTLLLAMSGSQPSDATLAHFDGFILKPLGAAEIEAAIAAHRGEDPAHRLTIVATAPKKAAKPRASVPATKKPRPAVLELLAASAAAPASKTSMGAGPIFPANAESLPLDETIYAQLASAMPAKQLHEMYAMCVNDARSRITNMRALAADRDDAQFMREAHAIKGSCGMLGATELHRIAASLEKHGSGPAGSAVNSLDELANACDRLERMLSARA